MWIHAMPGCDYPYGSVTVSTATIIPASNTANILISEKSPAHTTQYLVRWLNLSQRRNTSTVLWQSPLASLQCRLHMHHTVPQRNTSSVLWQNVAASEHNRFSDTKADIGRPIWQICSIRLHCCCTTQIHLICTSHWATDLTDMARRRQGGKWSVTGAKDFFGIVTSSLIRIEERVLSFSVSHPKHCCYGEEYCQFCLENNKNDNCTSENVTI